MRIRFISISLVLTISLAVMAMAGNVPRKTYTIAVLPMAAELEMGHVEALSLTMRLNDELDKTDLFYTLDLSQVEHALLKNDQDLLLCSTSECGTAAGSILQVDFLINGFVQKIGSKYEFQLRMIHVENEKVVQTISTDFEGTTPELHNFMKSIAKSFVGIQVPGIRTNVSLREQPTTMTINKPAMPTRLASNQRHGSNWLIYSLIVAGSAGLGMIMLNSNQNQ